MQNAPQHDAFLRSPPPKKREIRLAPPTPNKFASAVININRGTASVRIACGTGMLQNSSSFFFPFSMIRTPLFALFQAFDIALHRKMKAVIHRRRIVGEEPLLLLRHKSMDYGPK